MVHRSVRFLLLSLCVLVGGCAARPRLDAPLSRCIWIDRWDYSTAADVERAIEQSRRAGFTAVLFQVRGNGTAAWRSAHEVWSERFGFRDPGFDPLAIAVAAAHARGMQLHAWVNVVPGWVGVDDPADERQLWNSRRDWFVQDRNGKHQSRAKGKYLALDPARAEVRRYLADLCGEIARRYAVDGIHLDYVRYPNGPGDDLDALGAGAAAQTRAVTELVAGIRAAVKSSGKPILLSAAVFADPAVALQKVRQDWPDWCRRGLVDAVLPMNYTEQDDLFAARTRAAVEAAAGAPVIAGVGLYKHQGGAQTRRQLDAALRAGARGVGVFNYRTLFGPVTGDGRLVQLDQQREVAGWLEAAARRR